MRLEGSRLTVLARVSRARIETVIWTSGLPRLEAPSKSYSLQGTFTNEVKSQSDMVGRDNGRLALMHLEHRGHSQSLEDGGRRACNNAWAP